MIKKVLIQAIRHPYMALGALILTGALMVGLISLLGGGDPAATTNVPVIQAESRPFKVVPRDRGGMQIANKDSTVFDTLRSPNDLKAVPGGRVENLLDPPAVAANQAAAEKMRNFSNTVEKIVRTQEKRSIADDLAAQSRSEALLADARPDGAPNEAEDISAESLAQIQPAAGNADAEISRKSQATPASEPAPQQAERAASIDDTTLQAMKEATETIVKPNTKPAPPPSAQLPSSHAPGTSPDTIAYVRSVLDEKAQKMAALEPASGTAGPIDTPAAGGSFYVQLASVTSEQAAQSAWGKLQSQYPQELSSSSYRVETANLGPKGTYYRIQAGPYPEARAEQICTSIKAKKPGGCLVVKK